MNKTKNTAKRSRKCKDHLGKEFNSIADMCKYWNIPYITFYQRIKHGWSLDKALSKNAHTTNSVSCKDHLNNEFPSIAKMCEHYKISYPTFFQKRTSGWTLAEILEPEKYRKPKQTNKNTDNTIDIQLEIPDTGITLTQWLNSQDNIETSITKMMNKYIAHYGKSKNESMQKFISYLLAKNNLSIFIYWLTHDMNLSKTAKQFKLHRNTLVYRLSKLKDFGIDIHSIDGLAKLTDAIRYIQSYIADD